MLFVYTYMIEFDYEDMPYDDMYMPECDAQYLSCEEDY